MRKLLLLALLLSACASRRIEAKATQDLSCSGISFFSYPVNVKNSREESDGTSYEVCCVNDRSNCAHYFCPYDEKSGCQRL